MEGFTVVWFLVLGFEFFYMERFTVFLAFRFRFRVL